MFFSAWCRWLKRLAQAVPEMPRAAGKRGRMRRTHARTFPLGPEVLESRLVPSGADVARPIEIRVPLAPDLRPDTGPLMFRGAFAPAGIQKAYGIDQLIAAGNDGAGQTIALIDAFDNPAF